MLSALWCLACVPVNLNSQSSSTLRLLWYGHVTGEKGLHVVLVQEAARVGSQRKGELLCDFSYKALGFFPQRVGCAGWSGSLHLAFVTPPSGISSSSFLTVIVRHLAAVPAMTPARACDTVHAFSHQSAWES